MKLRIDHKEDALYLRLAGARIVDSEEVAPGVIVDFDRRDRVVGVEVLRVSERGPSPRSRKRSSAPAAVPALIREKPRRYGK